eukprot:CAMPEP_0198355210 /NCGR_PEP_ID=MMETSP1450-20131203/118270_1 /TAXON_ID=753684 ORGANISM="Madagascaria erythrocladiodes, Strain CCMP3234" /NCGR_SAMPLE_ID=MMETSP1450 /ASSEMBLY_ACC=CAM_ASM_001115 /LENGTH=113 /DNA_ID=CAMNT_0044061555 /DNA_START=104 /DNA_END=442 /DNA_ORIENTATION=-
MIRSLFVLHSAEGRRDERALSRNYLRLGLLLVVLSLIDIGLIFLMPRYYHHWQWYVLIAVTFFAGAVMAAAHCVRGGVLGLAYVAFVVVVVVARHAWYVAVEVELFEHYALPW